MRKFALAALLLLALVALTSRAAGPACSMKMEGMTARQCADCCAAMKSCILPKQNPTQPTTASTVDQQTVAMIAQALPVLLSELPVTRVAAPRLVTQSLAHSPPRFALFCSFLI